MTWNLENAGRLGPGVLGEFPGSLPALKTAHKGIEEPHIWLGVAVPGDTVGNLGSALHDVQRMEELSDTVRDYLAWQVILTV